LRRSLAVVSAILVLAGVEMSTEALTLTLRRLQAGLQALFLGVEFHVSPLRFEVGVAAIAGGIVLGALLLWASRWTNSIDAVGVLCPQCGARTRRVKRRRRHKLLSVLTGRRLTRRKCDVCGWHGLSARD